MSKTGQIIKVILDICPSLHWGYNFFKLNLSNQVWTREKDLYQTRTRESGLRIVTGYDRDI